MDNKIIKDCLEYFKKHELKRITDIIFMLGYSGDSETYKALIKELENNFTASETF